MIVIMGVLLVAVTGQQRGKTLTFYVINITVIYSGEFLFFNVYIPAYSGENDFIIQINLLQLQDATHCSPKHSLACLFACEWLSGIL